MDFTNFFLSALTASSVSFSVSGITALSIHDDCFNVFPSIPDKSINLIVCDLPFGVTDNSWDCVLPLDQLWAEYKRVLVDGGAIVLNAQMPFSAELVITNKKGFKSEYIWMKDKHSNFLNAKKMVMRKHESVLVFGKDKAGLKTYNPQFTEGKPYRSRSRTKTKNYSYIHQENYLNENTGFRYPVSLLSFPVVRRTSHPTEKPTSLVEYFIKTFSNPGDLVLDNCGGVGTAGVASLNTGRNCIVIEKEREYFDIGAVRLRAMTEISGLNSEIQEQ
jgi:site-specific DNA-methyltransferase (adenine-specific)